MTEAPQLVDRSALRAHRRRARTHDLFLQQIAVDEVQDRLSMVNRTFKSIAVVSPFPHVWRSVFPDATVVTDDEVLDLALGEYELVVHAMCLHWANDPVGQMIQCRRGLKEDGLFLAVLLGGQTLHELRSVLGQAEISLTGGLSPRVAPMAEIRDLGALLQRTELALPVADNVITKAKYRDLNHLMHDLREMGENNALIGRLRRPTVRAFFRAASDLYETHFGTDDGHILASFEIVCLTGWAASDTQPKPLRPGSAQARLADALQTVETKLQD